MFESLKPATADAILGLMAEYRADSREQKIDLGVGVYRTASGETPVLDVVKRAEQMLVDTQRSKAYVGTAGAADFNAAMQQLAFSDAADNERLTTVQTPGGSGSLRVAAGMIMRATPDATVWASEPTWANHRPLIGSAGLKLQPYPYYDTQNHVININAMLEALRGAAVGDVVLLHGCCHNPSGLDPSHDEWAAISDLLLEKQLIPFIDMAYQGFASDIDDDAFAVRYMAKRLPEMIVSTSCSKNFGLYRDRVGTLSMLSADAATNKIVDSQVNNLVRTLYSMPPDHGGAVVSLVLNDPELRARWLEELATMRDRLQEMRQLLHDTLQQKAPEHDFSHLLRANGMFCFLGISPEQVARLKTDHGVYMVNTSRVNLAGITADNVTYLADSIAATL